MEPEVLSLGDVNVDIIMYVDDLPSKGGESLSRRVEVRPGGAAANLAVALSRLGVPTGFIGAVGNDIFGDYLRRDLESEGVDTSMLARKEAASGFTVIVVTGDGERTMLGHRGANRILEPGDIDESYVERAEIVFISGYAFLESPQRDAALKVFGAAKQRGIPVAVDLPEVIASIGWEGIRQMVGTPDIIFVNERECNLLLKNDESKLKDVLRETAMLVVKMGAKGARLHTREGTFTAPAFKIEVVDTVGAGDAFDAGFIYALTRGLKPKECLVVGNAVAAWKCTGPGARHLPRPKDLGRFLAEHGYKDIEDALEFAGLLR